jgi:hypothetical protein
MDPGALATEVDLTNVTVLEQASVCALGPVQLKKFNMAVAANVSVTSTQSSVAIDYNVRPQLYFHTLHSQDILWSRTFLTFHLNSWHCSRISRAT